MTEKVYIRRAKHSAENPYFLLLRALAQDRTISFEARGVMAYILSKPDDWKVQPTDLEQQCGRQKVYSILKELKDAGYIVQEQRQGKNGRFQPGDYIVFEQPCDEKPHTVRPDTVRPQAVQPDTGKRHITESRVLQSKESQSTEHTLKSAVFDIHKVRDCVAWAAFGFRDMSKLPPENDEVMERLKKIVEWLLKHHPGMQEAQIAARVVEFKKAWPARRTITMPKKLSPFGEQWVAWEQASLPEPGTNSGTNDVKLKKIGGGSGQSI